MELSLKTLDYVVLIVRDLDVAVRFYCEVLGLALKHRADAYAQIEAGATRLGLYTREAMQVTLDRALAEPAAAAPAFEIGFKVEDVDAAFAELKRRGAQAVMAPRDRPWGQRTAYLCDPDGNLIELAQAAQPPS